MRKVIRVAHGSRKIDSKGESAGAGKIEVCRSKSVGVGDTAKRKSRQR